MSRPLRDPRTVQANIQRRFRALDDLVELLGKLGNLRRVVREETRGLGQEVVGPGARIVEGFLFLVVLPEISVPS